ncbi:MAG: histidine kinase dimerization/phospho-acceptor domain-containing protein, partial [Paracoccaceae bacterium]
MREAKDILLALGIPVAAFDRTLRLVVANGQAQRLLPAAVPGAQAKDVFSRKAVIAKLLSVLETGNAETLSVKPRTERDHDLFLTITRVISRSREKDLLILVTIEDRSPLREAKAMRSDFVANVSHEIRSPLTAISGFVETLQGGMVDDEEARSHFLGLMEKEATRMKNLVTDLLSLSQVEVKENRQIKKPADL